MSKYIQRTGNEGAKYSVVDLIVIVGVFAVMVAMVWDLGRDRPQVSQAVASPDLWYLVDVNNGIQDYGLPYAKCIQERSANQFCVQEQRD